MSKKRTEIRQGFTIRDENFLRKYDNPKADPDVQIFSAESFEEEEKELREYYCACCKSRLDYHNHLDVWLCPQCFQQY